MVLGIFKSSPDHSRFLQAGFEGWEVDAILAEKAPLHVALDQTNSKESLEKVFSYLLKNQNVNLSRKDDLTMDAWDHANLSNMRDPLLKTLFVFQIKNLEKAKQAFSSSSSLSRQEKQNIVSSGLASIQKRKDLFSKSFKEDGAYAPLFKASLRGDASSMDAFLKSDPSALQAKTQEENYSLLDLAALGGDVETLRVIFNHKQNLSSESGKNALHMACIGGKKEAVKFLLEQGAALEQEDQNTLRPLHHALLAKNMDAASYLIEKGASIGSSHSKSPSPFESFDLALQMNRNKPFELTPQSYSELLRMLLFFVFASFSSSLEERAPSLPIKALFSALFAFCFDSFFNPSFATFSKDLPEQVRPAFEYFDQFTSKYMPSFPKLSKNLPEQTSHAFAYFCKFASGYIPFFLHSQYDLPSSTLSKLFIKATSAFFLLQEFSSCLSHLDQWTKNLKLSFKQFRYSPLHALKNTVVHLVNGALPTLYSLSYLKSASEVVTGKTHTWENNEQDACKEFASSCESEPHDSFNFVKAMNCAEPSQQEYPATTISLSRRNCKEISRDWRKITRSLHPDKPKATEIKQTYFTRINEKTQEKEVFGGSPWSCALQAKESLCPPIAKIKS